jgi:CBS domain-containing protein
MGGSPSPVLMRVRDWMAKPVITIRPEATLEEAARLLVENRIGCLVVVDAQGRLAGILTESDFEAQGGATPFAVLSHIRLLGQWMNVTSLETILRQARTDKVAAHMQPRAVTLHPEATLEEAANLMVKRKIHHVPIVEDGKPVGMIARRELLRVLAGV